MAHTHKDPATGDGGAQGDCSGKIEQPQNKSPESLPQGKAWKRAATDTLLVLRANFPQCFARLDRRSRPPLKLGIHADIIAALPELSPVDIARALKVYVGHFNYLKQCTEGKSRIGLDGQPAGVVTAEEAAHCKQTIAGILKKRQPQPAPASPPKPQRLTLAALREAAAKRKLETSGA